MIQFRQLKTIDNIYFSFWHKERVGNDLNLRLIIWKEMCR